MLRHLLVLLHRPKIIQLSHLLIPLLVIGSLLRIHGLTLKWLNCWCLTLIAEKLILRVFPLKLSLTRLLLNHRLYVSPLVLRCIHRVLYYFLSLLCHDRLISHLSKLCGPCHQLYLWSLLHFRLGLVLIAYCIIFIGHWLDRRLVGLDGEPRHVLVQRRDTVLVIHRLLVDNEVVH